MSVDIDPILILYPCLLSRFSAYCWVLSQYCLSSILVSRNIPWLFGVAFAPRGLTAQWQKGNEERKGEVRWWRHYRAREIHFICMYLSLHLPEVVKYFSNKMLWENPSSKPYITVVFFKVSAPLPPQSAAPFLLSCQSCQSERDLICPATISKLEVTGQRRPRNSKSLK